jgi:ATP-dependent DNA ligase
MNFPTLFKKTSTGALQSWAILTKGAVIWTTFGQVGGKLQTSMDVISEGKNLGKANATDAEAQANAEAQAKWEKQLKKGYVKTIEEAEAGKVDACIEGGLAPMLAHTFSKQGHKIVFPAYVQPKFDGHRCIATIDEDGEAHLWSRTRKPVTGLPHINAAVKRLAIATGFCGPFDGELYNHDYRDNFEDLTSFIRNPEPKAGGDAVQYHIYDLAMDNTPFQERENILASLQLESPLVTVKTLKVADEDDMLLAFERFLALGYEGLMVRNAKGMYVNKRSVDLQKVKVFDSEEFLIVGVESGRGKMSDKAIFVCKTQTGTEFRVKMKGALADLRKYVTAPSLAIGRQLEVQFQGRTGDGSLRFPVGLRLRDDV